MREIKFRAWDAEHKKMRGHTDPQTIQAVIFGNDYGGRIEIMQYTGLKDKNGKEIYEGDIASCVYNGNSNIYTVVFDLSELDYKATNGKKNYGENFQYMPCCEEIEIIGNIYENPELL